MMAVMVKRTYIAEKKYQCFPEERTAQNINSMVCLYSLMEDEFSIVNEVSVSREKL